MFQRLSRWMKGSHYFYQPPINHEVYIYDNIYDSHITMCSDIMPILSTKISKECDDKLRELAYLKHSGKKVQYLK